MLNVPKTCAKHKGLSRGEAELSMLYNLPLQLGVTREKVTNKRKGNRWSRRTTENHKVQFSCSPNTRTIVLSVTKKKKSLAVALWSVSNVVANGRNKETNADCQSHFALTNLRLSSILYMSTLHLLSVSLRLQRNTAGLHICCDECLCHAGLQRFTAKDNYFVDFQTHHEIYVAFPEMNTIKNTVQDWTIFSASG